MKKPPKNDLVKLLAFFAVLLFCTLYLVVGYAANWYNAMGSSCEITKPMKVIGGKLYNSWGPTQYFLSYAGKDKITGHDCVVSKVPVTLNEYERRMYAGGK